MRRTLFLDHALLPQGWTGHVRITTDDGLITAIDPARGRIALNTALLEGPAGELLIAKETVMAEAEDRAHRARSLLRQQEQDAG